VSDRGIGIAEHDRERIFDWFARGGNAESMSRGIGIGLAGSRSIVEQHGGTLSVESELGAGSSFTIELPLDAAG
jgi:signal transduction histidine kinase